MIKEYLDHKFSDDNELPKKTGLKAYKCINCSCIGYYNSIAEEFDYEKYDHGPYLTMLHRLELNCGDWLVKGIIE